MLLVNEGLATSWPQSPNNPSVSKIELCSEKNAGPSLLQNPESPLVRSSYIVVFPHPLLRSVARGTPSAPAADALYVLVIFHLGPGNPADACAVEIRLLGLDAPQAAEL